MAAALPPPLLAPPFICAIALGLSLLIAGWLAATKRPAVAADPLWLAFSLSTAVLLSLVVAGVFQTPERILPPLAGTWVGAATAWFWLPRATEARWAPAGALASGVATWAAIALFWQGVPAANAAIGWLAGAAGVGLLSHLGPSGRQLDAVWTLLACAGGLAVWLDKMFPQQPQGWPVAVALLLIPLLAWLAPLQLTWRHSIILAGTWGLGAAWWLQGVFHLPVSWALAATLGALGGLMATTLLRPDRVTALLVLVAGGALVIIENRVAGVAGIALGGIGLASQARLTAEHPWARGVLVWLVAVFASRAWLQLFFERVEFTHYGVDITHPYATAGLLLGALLPAALVLRPATAQRVTHIGLTLGAIGLPIAVGYLLHIEALAAAWMGLLTGGFVLIAAQPRPAQAAMAGGSPESPAFAPTLLLVHSAVALLAAPWLVSALDATRLERVGVMLGLTLVTAFWLALAVRETAGGPGSHDAPTAS